MGLAGICGVAMTAYPCARRAINSSQRRRLEAAIEATIRRYRRCLKSVPDLDKEVYAAGMELFEDESSLATWLCEPARALSGKVPLDVMRLKKGREEVVSILRSIAQGNYL